MRRPLRLGAAILLAGLATTAAAEEGTATVAVDPRVETTLKAAGLSYTVDDGDFRLLYHTNDGRSQLVWVASKTSKVHDLELRDVWSIAYRGNGAPSPELANRLLSENVRMVLGAWQVNQGKDDYLVVFSSPVAADADAATLADVVEAVMVTADRMEKELSGKDEF